MSSRSPAQAAPAATPSFVVLIPARLASTRLPDKPLAEIAGIPMVVRVANQARQSQAVRVAIATDSPRIADVARAHGHEAIMTRADHASGTERLAEAITLMELAEDTIVVNVQGDEPEIPPALIDALASCLASDPECPMATAVHPVQSVADWLNPNVVKVVADAEDRALLFSRAPLPWSRSQRPSFPARVVLPAPWRPASMMMVGPRSAQLISRACPPRTSMSSSLTILTTCWAGLRAWERAASLAFSRTAAVKERTTGRATSASSRARRISVTVKSISASVSRPLPRSEAKAAVSRSERLPNTRCPSWGAGAPCGFPRPTAMAGLARGRGHDWSQDSGRTGSAPPPRPDRD